MVLYLHDDSADALLVRLLRAAGHDVQTPYQVNLSGEHDVIHFMHVVRTGCALVTRNHDDFKRLHEVVLLVGWHHPGILVIRQDNDPRRDMRPRGIVQAIQNLSASGIPIPDQLHIVNQWR